MKKNQSSTGNANSEFPPFNYPDGLNGMKYVISAEANPDDLVDRLETILLHLDSMLYMTWGTGGESFRNYSDNIQDSYMWACSETATECLELARQLIARMDKQ